MLRFLACAVLVLLVTWAIPRYSDREAAMAFKKYQSDGDPLDCRYCERCRSQQPVYRDIVDGVDELRCRTCGKAHKRGRVNTKMSGQSAVVRRMRE